MNETPHLFSDSADSWQMKVQESVQHIIKIPFKFPLPWLLIAGILFGIGVSIVKYYSESGDALRLCAINAVLIAALANGVVFFEMLLDHIADAINDLLKHEKPEKIQEWIRDLYNNIFWSMRNVYTGIVLGALAVWVRFDECNVVFQSVPGKVYACFMNAVIGFLGGSMFWVMLGIAGKMLSLGKEIKIKPSIFDSSTSSLHIASSALWKISFIAALTYLLGISPYFFCKIDVNPYVRFFLAFFGLFVVLYFIIPQVNIHKTLITKKREKLESLVIQIDAAFDAVTEKPTAANINQLHKLFDLQTIVNGKRSWSFGMTELLVLLGSVLVPLLLFLFECVFSKFF